MSNDKSGVQILLTPLFTVSAQVIVKKSTCNTVEEKEWCIAQQQQTRMTVAPPNRLQPHRSGGGGGGGVPGKAARANPGLKATCFQSLIMILKRMMKDNNDALSI